MTFCTRCTLLVFLLSFISLYSQNLENEDASTEIIIAYNLEFPNETLYEPEIYGLFPCSDYDQIKVIGKVVLNNATLNAIGGYTNSFSDEIVLIDNDSTEAIIGTFSNFSEGDLISFGDFSGSISYQGGDGNDVVLKGLPEDTEPPTIVCSETITIDTDTGSCTATYEIPIPEVNDAISSAENISISVTRSDNLSLATPFSIGQTILTFIATDEAENSSEPCEQIIIVQDSEKPELICLAPINIDSSSSQFGQQLIAMVIKKFVVKV